MQPQRNIISGDAVDELDDAAQEFGGNTAINLNADNIVQLQDDQGNSKGVPNEKIGEITAMLTGASENQSGGGENTKGDEDPSGNNGDGSRGDQSPETRRPEPPSGNNGDGSRDATNNYIYRDQADTSSDLDSPPRAPGNSNRGGVLPPASSGGSVGGGSGGAPSGASGGGGLSTGTKAAAAAGTGAVGLGAAWYFGLL
jgi:hypothetical protein